MVQSELISTTTADLLEQLAGLDRKKQPRLLQQIRAELAMRGVRYREQQISATEPPQYHIEQTGFSVNEPLLMPLIRTGSVHSQWGRWGFLLLLFLVIFAASHANAIISKQFQAVAFVFWLGLGAFGIVVEMLMWHSQTHRHYLAFWLGEGNSFASTAVQRLILYCFALLMAILLTHPLGWLGHRLSARVMTQQVLLVDMQRDYTANCPFRLRLQFTGPQYRWYCLTTDAQYELFRPNDLLEFRGTWSLFGISGQVQPFLPVNTERQ